MFWTFMVVIFLVVAAVIAWRGKISYIPEDERDRSFRRQAEPERRTLDLRMWALAPLMLGLIFLLLGATYRVGTGEAVVLISPAGAYEATDSQTGWKFKAPWTKAETWDLRNNRVEFNGGEDADGDTIRTATKDPVDTWFDMTVTYDLNPRGLREAFTQYRNQERLEAEQIVRAFASKAKDAPTTYTAVQIRGQRPALSQAIRSDLTTRLEKFGVNVSDVDLQEIGLPNDVVANLNKVQAKAAEAEAKRSELTAANIDAEKARVTAQGEADADQITRCGATTEVRTEDVNGKPTQVTRVIPNQTCDPNRLNSAVLTARYIQMLEKRSGDTTIVLPPSANALLNLGAPAAAR